MFRGSGPRQQLAETRVGVTARSHKAARAAAGALSDDMPKVTREKNVYGRKVQEKALIEKVWA